MAGDPVYLGSHPTTMRRLLPLVLCCWVARLCAQTYVPFPTDTAVWNGIYLWNGSPNPAEQYEIVYRHVLGGDTVLEGTAYKKLHYNAGGVAWDYYGGIREDDQRNIWYRPPGWAILIGDVYPQTPAGTDEVLLYTFNDLEVGTILPIGMDPPSSVTVTGIDSVLVQDSYRKRYTIQNMNLLQEDHWIEGIGSTVDLFAPFLFEFEWTFSTRCFQAPGVAWENPDDFWTTDCAVVMGATEQLNVPAVTAYPNPGNNIVYLQGLPPAVHRVQLHDAMGRVALETTAPFAALDVSALAAGVYTIDVFSTAGRYCKPTVWVKE